MEEGYHEFENLWRAALTGLSSVYYQSCLNVSIAACIIFFNGLIFLPLDANEPVKDLK
jgi:hypothetical protein